AVPDPREPPPQLRPARLAARDVARQRPRRLPHDREVPVRPGAHLHPRRASLLPLHVPLLGHRRAGRARPRRRDGVRVPALSRARQGRAPPRPQHRLRRGLVRRSRRRPARAAHRRGGLHGDRQGGHRRVADVRQRRGRPVVRLRHGSHGPGAAAAHLGATEAGL
ncbi:MAG: DUF1794, partial [uncultured Nocardioides sp.]